MICFNCRKQIPDGVQTCPNCGAPTVHQQQIVSEIKLRRYQRWGFYGLVVLLFAAMTAYAVKIYSDNTALSASMTERDQKILSYQKDLDTANQNLTAKDMQLSQQKQQLDQLNQKTSDFQKDIAAKAQQLSQYEQFKVELGAANANVYAALVKLGTGLANKDLSRIMVADYNLSSGADSDNDGLSDVAEEALGTDKSKADTDGDGYKDKDEIIAGYDPLGPDKLPLDKKFSDSQKGKIFLQVDKNGEAWYISTVDSKRYFLGRPKDAVAALESLLGQK